MKVSIITVVYNNQKTIKEAIDSVINQTYKNIEYIIIDGCSNDGTLNVIREHENDISVIISEPDKGIYDAMNKGIAAASGDVIGILNSDDLYANNNVIEQVMSYFNKDLSLDIIYGNLMYVKTIDTNAVVRKWTSLHYYNKYFENGNVPPHPTVFLKSAVYDVAGTFNISYKLAADYEFLLRIFKKYQFKSMYINTLMVKMRLGGATNKNIKNIFNGNKEIIAAWKNNKLKPPLFLMPLRIVKRLTQFF